MFFSDLNRIQIQSFSIINFETIRTKNRRYEYLFNPLESLSETLSVQYGRQCFQRMFGDAIMESLIAISVKKIQKHRVP